MPVDDGATERTHGIEVGGLTLSSKVGANRQTLHAHRQLEIVLALDEPVTVDLPGDVTQTSTSFIMPPLRPHACGEYKGRLITLFVHLTYEQVRRWKGTSPTFGSLDHVLDDARTFYASQRDIGQACALIDRCVSACVEMIEHHDEGGDIDLRIEAVLQALEAWHLPVEGSRTTLARSAGLSPSRFAALFAENVGVPLSRYLLWRRAETALTLTLSGSSIMAAAHEAGFADNSHFTRICRRVYGWPPSQLCDVPPIVWLASAPHDFEASTSIASVLPACGKSCDLPPSVYIFAERPPEALFVASKIVSKDAAGSGPAS